MKSREGRNKNRHEVKSQSIFNISRDSWITHKTKCENKQTVSTQTKLQLNDNSIQLAIKHHIIYTDIVSMWLKLVLFLNTTLNYQLFPRGTNQTRVVSMPH